MTPRKVAVCEVTLEALARLLKLPPTMRIAAIYQQLDLFASGSVYLLLEGDGLPDFCVKKEGERAVKVMIEHDHSAAPASITKLP